MALFGMFFSSTQHNKTINNIRFAHWEKASLSLCFSRYCKRYAVC